SIRELNLTGRNYKQVLDAACYAAFQEGYKAGFGADGDHLKLEEDVKMSIELGFSMLTLDCSDKIDNDIDRMDEAAIAEKYASVSEDVRSYYEAKFLDQSFQVGEHTVRFAKLDVMKNVLIYGTAI